MRKGPSESATEYPLHTKKRGNDGEMWRVVSAKRGTRKIRRWQRDETVLFVIYKNATDARWGQDMRVGNFKWRFTGSGTTLPLGSAPGKYPRELQFNGPIESREKTKRYLVSYMDKLKRKGVVERFKVVNKFPKS